VSAFLGGVRGPHASVRCYPPYLSAKAHAKLSRPDAFAGLRIHTDEINEVIARIKSATLTIAVVRSKFSVWTVEIVTNGFSDHGFHGLV
jgi:hypothetical protein